jgi:outer membrane protein TolC
MDTSMGEDRSMAMVALELPWGWGGRRAGARAATREIAAAEAAQRAVADGALAELRGAHARAVSSREVLALHETDILPSSERTADSVRAAWVAGEASLADLLDSLDAQLASRIEADGARSRLEAALAELDRAAGVDPLSTAGDR